MSSRKTFFLNFPHNREIAAREYRLLDTLWLLIYSWKQAEALQFVSAGHNLLITGKAGVG